MRTDEKSAALQSLREDPSLHEENLHELFIHFITSPPEGCILSREKMGELRLTYDILRDTIKNT